MDPAAYPEDVFIFTAEASPVVDTFYPPTELTDQPELPPLEIYAVTADTPDASEYMPDLYASATTHAAVFYAEHGYLPAGAEVGEEWTAADVAYINAFIALSAGWG